MDNDERSYFTELLCGDLNGRFYRHFKGGLYQVLGSGTHSETEEALVVYRAAEMRGPVNLAGRVLIEFQLSRTFWCRPKEMFYGTKDGKPRFQKVHVCPSCEGTGTEPQHFEGRYGGVTQVVHCQTCRGERTVPVEEVSSTYPSIEVVVAVDEDMGIGHQGKLPWGKLPADMRHFRELTRASQGEGRRNAVIMGRKTWESIPPEYQPLKGRINVVLSSNPDLRQDLQDKAYVFDSLQRGLDMLARVNNLGKVFVIGGASVYAEAMQLSRCKRLHVTRVMDRYDRDVSFPPIPEDFILEWQGKIGTGSQGLLYQFERYTRR